MTSKRPPVPCLCLLQFWQCCGQWLHTPAGDFLSLWRHPLRHSAGGGSTHTRPGPWTNPPLHALEQLTRIWWSVNYSCDLMKWATPFANTKVMNVFKSQLLEGHSFCNIGRCIFVSKLKVAKRLILFTNAKLNVTRHGPKSQSVCQLIYLALKK